MRDHYERFKQGWMTEDIDMMLEACADDFVYDDAIDGRIPREEFADYYRGLSDGDLVISDEVLQETDGVTTAWYWWSWRRPGETEWAQEGTGLTRADAKGIHLERIAYYKQ